MSETVAPIGGGIYGQAFGVGISVGSGTSGGGSVSLYEQVSAGVAAALGYSWNYSSSGGLTHNWLAAIGVGTITGTGPLAAALLYDFSSGHVIFAYGYGLSDIVEGGLYTEFATLNDFKRWYADNYGYDPEIPDSFPSQSNVTNPEWTMPGPTPGTPDPMVDVWAETTPAPCFSAGTPILLADGTSVGIEDIRVGMRVAAFDERDAAGTGALTSGLVTRLIPGITSEWIVLDDTSSARLREATRVTPHHRYLRPDGTFMAIADIIAGDGLVVDADGAIAQVTGTLLRATDAGSDATWIEPDAIDAGGVLMRSAPVLGWRTYNFTVDGLHTYVAANDNTSPEVSRAA